MSEPAAESRPPNDPEPWGWTRAHRVGIALLLGVALVYLAIGFARNPWRLDDPVVVVQGKAVVLEQQVDPNTADWPSLARLPRLGEMLARRLVAYRQEQLGAGPGDGIVFHRLEDLDKVGGFGERTREALRPYLKFPATGVPRP